MGKTYRNNKSDNPKHKHKGNQSKGKDLKRNNSKKGGKFRDDDFDN